MSESVTRDPLVVGGEVVAAGTRVDVGLPTARLVSGEGLTLPVIALHGAQDGPTVWLSAALHGDEINGVEIIPRVVEQLDPSTLRGTVLAVPVVNVHGFIAGNRYLPDRRDLNRCFPGSPKGSLASQIAHTFMTEIVAKADIGIDLHTGSEHRTNLPQIRANLDDERTAQLAKAFGAPVMLHAKTLDGSLRRAAAEAGVAALLFEAGEAWRFDEHCIQTGVAGVLRVLAAADVIDPVPAAAVPTVRAGRSTWMRAPRSGVFHARYELGDSVRRGQLLGTVDTTLGERLGQVKARIDGLIIGCTNNPLVNRGDAVVHLAEVSAEDGPA